MELAAKAVPAVKKQRQIDEIAFFMGDPFKCALLYPRGRERFQLDNAQFGAAVFSVLMLVTPSGSERFAFLATAPGNADGSQQVRRHTPSDVAAQSRDETRTVNSPVSRLSQADQECMRLYIAGAIRPDGGNPAIKQ
ncbi:MAG: hypothetical protein WB679_02045, partial [Terracidiphilus sp.]